jgi:peptidoglycan/xylan/chitin deacetylase (PgdA/CDA1 family)
MGLIRQSIKALLTAGMPADWWLVRGPRGRLTDAPTFSLTFDDGPHPEHTPRVLDALQQYGLTATFFVVGREAVRYPELVRRIVDEGHSLGNHTFTHSELDQTSPAQFLDEVRCTRDLLSLWIDEPCRWMRPPKGELSWPKLRGLWRTGHTVVLWNIDPRDYRMSHAAEIDRWCRAYQPNHGDIVLLHDNRPASAEILAVWGRLGLFDRWRSAPIDAWIDRKVKSQPRSFTEAMAGIAIAQSL